MPESIYKFVEEPQPPKPKKEIYKSKYDPKGPLIGSTFCMQGTTVVDGKGFHSLKKVRTNIFMHRLDVMMYSHTLVASIKSINLSGSRREHFFWKSTRVARPEAFSTKRDTGMQRRSPNTFGGTS